MKKKLTGILVFFLIIGFASLAGAYSYSFDIQGGSLSLDVTENCEMVSIFTNSDLVIDVDFDLPTEDMLLQHTASMNIDLTLFGFLGLPTLSMTDIDLGAFIGVNPAEFLGDGTSVETYLGSSRINAQFGTYALTDALFEYDVMVTPDLTVDNRYAIDINTLSISEGNTSEMFWGVLNELIGSDMVPAGVDLTPPFTIFGSVTGSLDIQADPVPVPAAIWLLGSGLLGLAGFKRRQT